MALVVSLAFRAPLEAAGLGWLLWAALTGLVLGVIGLVAVQVIRRRVGTPLRIVQPESHAAQSIRSST